MATSKRMTRREFLSAGAAAAMAFGSRVAAGAPQDPVVNAAGTKGRSRTREKVAWRVEPFPIQQVKLLDGPFRRAMEINQRYLHALPNDRLLHMFRLTAGLPSSAEPLGGWEEPKSELRGHLTGGHYLSACALTYASLGDEELKKKADALVAELARCQQALDSGGYLGAYPTEFYDRLRNAVKVWAPFYTYHKIMAGHLDMFLYCGNEQALATAEKMAAWAGSFIRPLSDEHLARVQLVEHGGMNEVLFNLYAVTGKEEYLALARRFDHRKLFDPLAEQRDELKGLHVNTQIPKVIGAARGYELTADPRYRTIADYFWRQVTSQRSYCTGGTSNGEAWRTDPGRLASELGPSAQECCCSYNMLKLTRHLFGWTAEAPYTDYYERVLFNLRLGTQDPDGMLMYYVSLYPGLWKTFGTATQSMWCCTGTGIEEFARSNDTIFFHDVRGLYVNLFIAAELHWPEKGLRLRQLTRFPEEEGTTLTFDAAKGEELALHIRVPYWAARGVAVKVNGAAQRVDAKPASYMTLRRRWKRGDRVEVRLPMSLHVAPLPDDRSLQAVLYGPLVLAGRLGNEGLSKENLYARLAPGPRSAAALVPPIRTKNLEAMDWVEKAPADGLAFQTAGQERTIALAPLYQILHEKYVVYWKLQA
jgi:DUF1680 family protein